MKKTFSVLFSVIILFSIHSCVLAENSPLFVSNNKFGIHIIDEKDLPDAAALVNSSGGDWGYVTFVITEAERNHDRWQQVFDQMRRLHLIPIVRIATKAEGEIWQIPKSQEINNWIAFLNSLNWVVQNRYIVIGNEPNLVAEWGGKADPAAYASYLKDFSQKLKSASEDFFVLPAGMAPDKNEFRFIKSMLKAEPGVFDYIDGWASHSYPTASIDLYKDELKFIGKNLPVFITETGWSNKTASEEDISSKIANAYKNVWSDAKVVAVTPFILNYPNPPFDIFSWKKRDGNYYSFYGTVRDLPKIKGEPMQISQGQILAALAQPVIFSGGDFVGAVLAKNTGQSIWSPYFVSIKSEEGNLVLRNASFDEIEPMRLGLIVFKAASPENLGVYSTSLFLNDTKGNKFTNSFRLQAVVVKLDKVQMGSIFDKIGAYLKSRLQI